MADEKYIQIIIEELENVKKKILKTRDIIDGHSDYILGMKVGNTNDLVIIDSRISELKNEIKEQKQENKVENNKPLDMQYVGFSSHDCESWYRCPICRKQYGGWSFINGRITVKDGKFKCVQCGAILNKPK